MQNKAEQKRQNRKDRVGRTKKKGHSRKDRVAKTRQIKQNNEIKHAARVLSRYRDARRTRILRIRLRLTVRVNKTEVLYS